MQRRMYNDTETYSEIPISHGAHAYSEKVEVMLWSYAFDDEPVKLWDRIKDKKMPEDLRAGLEDPDVTAVFHNGGGFDSIMIRKDLGIDLPPQRIHDTMARAYSHGLPGGLDILCDIFNAPVSKAKDKEGKKFIQLFCQPRPANQTLRRATRETHPLEWDRFCTYAKFDIEAMRFIDKQMPNWNYINEEYDLWCLDQKINNRGICIDLKLPEAAIRAVKRAQKKLAARTDDLTLGDVVSTTQRDQLLRHILQAYGIELPDLQAATLERRMEDPSLPPEVKELLSIRLQASSTSTAKYAVFLRMTSPDGRLRGTLQFSGASRTKRWAGRGVQLQNLLRPTMKPEVIAFGIEALKADCEDLYFEDVMELAANAVRGCLVAAEGKKLVVSDLSNIEGRKAAWLTNENWKLQAFRAYDRGEGADLYKVSYANAFKIRADEVDGGKKSGPQRQIGKVMELMLQYQGGVGAFLTGAATYKIDLEDMARKALSEIPDDVIEEALAWWEESIKRGQTYDLTRDVFLACDGLKRLWRRAHPQTTSYWPELEDAARNAIDSKNKVYTARRLSFVRNGNWLRMILPSGFSLCYAAPRVDEEGKITYMGMDQYKRKWSRLGTYGGKLFENATQASSRDVMAWNMQPAEDAGYPIVTHTHDELVTEPTDSKEFTAEGLSDILATNPKWAQGLPLAAGGFESYRYKKSD